MRDMEDYLGNNKNKYVNLKRKIYLLLFITDGAYWLFSQYVDDFMRIALPLVCLFFAIIWVLIYKNLFFVRVRLFV